MRTDALANTYRLTKSDGYCYSDSNGDNNSYCNSHRYRNGYG